MQKFYEQKHAKTISPKRVSWDLYKILCSAPKKWQIWKRAGRSDIQQTNSLLKGLLLLGLLKLLWLLKETSRPACANAVLKTSVSWMKFGIITVRWCWKCSIDWRLAKGIIFEVEYCTSAAELLQSYICLVFKFL